MIVWYFCRRFLSAFILVLLLMTSVLSMINVVGKNIFLSIELVMALFIGALPFMAVFIYPFALLFGCLFIIYTMYHRGEETLISFFPRLRQQFAMGIFFAGLFATIIFIPLIFWIAPRSYDWGKQLLYKVAEQRLVTLAPNLLHFPAPHVAVYFEQITTHRMTTIFHNFFLIQEKSIQQTHGINFIMHGDHATLSDKKLFFRHGTILGLDKTSGLIGFSATFDDGLLDLERLFVYQKNSMQTPAKYKTIEQLWHDDACDAVLERWKRYVQIVWILLSPLLGLILSTTRVIQKMYGIICGAVTWFFLQYLLLLNVSFFHSQAGRLGLYFLFLMPIMIVSTCYYFVRAYPKIHIILKS